MEGNVREKIRNILAFFITISSFTQSLFKPIAEDNEFLEKEIFVPLMEIEKATKNPEITNIIKFLKQAHSDNHIVYHEKLCGKEAEEKVIKPLEKIIGISAKNDKEIRTKSKQFAKRINRKINSKTLKERREKQSLFISKLKTVGLVIIGLAAFGIGAYGIYHRKKRKEKAEK